MAVWQVSELCIGIGTMLEADFIRLLVGDRFPSEHDFAVFSRHVGYSRGTIYAAVVKTTSNRRMVRVYSRHLFIYLQMHEELSSGRSTACNGHVQEWSRSQIDATMQRLAINGHDCLRSWFCQMSF